MEELTGSHFFTPGAKKAVLKIRGLAAGAIFAAPGRLPGRATVAQESDLPACQNLTNQLRPILPNREVRLI
jgi:hypothetical protein